MIQQGTTEVTVPGDLNSPRAKLVYLYISTQGSATIGELQESLAMKKITLYSILKTLRERGLIGQETDRYVLN